MRSVTLNITSNRLHMLNLFPHRSVGLTAASLHWSCSALSGCATTQPNVVFFITFHLPITGGLESVKDSSDFEVCSKTTALEVEFCLRCLFVSQ